jgi:WD40 repeat protein
MAGGDGSIHLWDVVSSRVRAVFPGHHSMIWALAFSPDGRCLASGGDDLTIRLWHVPETEGGEPSTPFSSPRRTGGH